MTDSPETKMRLLEHDRDRLDRESKEVSLTLHVLAQTAQRIELNLSTQAVQQKKIEDLLEKIDKRVVILELDNNFSNRAVKAIGAFCVACVPLFVWFFNVVMDAQKTSHEVQAAQAMYTRYPDDKSK